MADKIAIAVDASPQAEHAYNWYVNNVHKPENEVLLIHAPEILEAASSHSMSFSPGAWKEMYDEHQVKIQKMRASYEQKMKEANVNGRWVTVDHSGKAGEAIVKAAADLQATCIITGSRGMGKLRRTMLGSVSDFLVHHAHVPVLVCRQ